MPLIHKFLWALFCVLFVVIGPYIYSRIVSAYQPVNYYKINNAITQPKSSIHVLSYNIAHGRGLADSNWDGGSTVERSERLDNIAKLIRETNADVVILNEVDFDSSWSNHVNQAEYLAKAAGYAYVAEQRNLDFRVLAWTWRFGNAILSKHPIIDTQLIDFPNYANYETILAGKKRGLVSTIQVGTDKVQLMAVHLSHRSESLRAASAELLTTNITLPTIIGGDFNSAPTGFPVSMKSASDENAIDVLDRSQLFIRKPESPPVDTDAYTFPANKPDRVIDWIFASKHFTYTGFQVIKSELSDHRPILVELTLNQVKTVSSAQ